MNANKLRGHPKRLNSQHVFCSFSLQIKSGSNLPEQICTYCLIDLGHAFKFRQTCERSDAILQSFVDSAHDNGPECTTDEYDEQVDLPNESASGSGIVVGQESTGSMYEYWPPSGLNVKLVRNESSKRDPSTSGSALAARKRQNEVKMNVVKSEPLDIYDIEEQEEHLDDTMSDSEILISDDFNETSDSEPIRMDKSKRSIDGTGPTRVLTQIKPVKTNKARLGLTAAQTTASSLSTSRKQMKVVKKADGGDVARKPAASKEQKSPKTCPICGNTYKYQHALESHMRRHRNEKPFVCSVCDKGFVINFELTRHMRTVSNERSRNFHVATNEIFQSFTAHGPETVRVQILRSKIFRFRQSRETRANTHRRASICLRTVWQNIHIFARTIQSYADPHGRKEIPVSLNP